MDSQNENVVPSKVDEASGSSCNPGVPDGVEVKPLEVPGSVITPECAVETAEEKTSVTVSLIQPTSVVPVVKKGLGIGQGKKICPSCQYVNGAKAHVCPKCKHVFVIKAQQPKVAKVRVSKTKNTKVLKSSKVKPIKTKKVKKNKK